MKIPDSLKIWDNLQKLCVPESLVVGILEHIKIAAKTPPSCSDSLGNEETLGELDDVEEYCTKNYDC
jgi:hypothetical protein